MIEFETRILEINQEELEEKLRKLKAKKIGTYNQKRAIFDFNPPIKNKWLQLRTNGETTSLTIKEIKDSFAIDGTEEIEVTVSDYEESLIILKELGYTSRNVEEYQRTLYRLNDIEFFIDSWPLIPTFLEIEGESVESVLAMKQKLDYPENQCTNLDVESIYNEIYHIDIHKIPYLRKDTKN